MLRLRAEIKQKTPRKSRDGASGLHGIEACLVSPLIDLEAEDMVCGASDPGGGKAMRLHAPASGSERLWVAAGAAATLRANAVRTGARDGAVLVCYARASDASPAGWARFLAHLCANKLPLLLVVLAEDKKDGSRNGRLSALALRNRVPGIPVDLHDAVALYRVAQESIGHARIGGGGALIECVRYRVEGGKSPAPDALDGLAQYMLARQVADRRWLDVQARSVAKRAGR